MKSKKQGSRCPQPEECGVWLDTAELKKRSHQTVIPCTYSSRFNPLLRRLPVDSAGFEFTQTKTPMLCTKQTSMYAFFTSKGKKVAAPTTSHETLPRSLYNKGKAEENDAEPLNDGTSADYADEPLACQNTSYNPHSNIQQSAQLWKESCDECSSATDGLVDPKDILQSPSVRICCPADVCTSSATKQHSIAFLDSPLCSHCPEVHDKELYTESQQHSQLFTQDSQGYRVIAHRAASEKTSCLSSPLQDRTNVPWDAASPMKRSRQYRYDEDSLRCIFTQDSEGNKVIKH
ncbi:aurora kinase A- and ninein-interacting protein [Mantella aurantiaca]